MKPNRRKPKRPPSLETLEAQLRQLPSPEVPDGLRDRLMAGIPARQATGKDRLRRVWSWRYLAPTASLAAGLTLAVFVTRFYMHHAHTPARPSGSSIVEIDVKRMIEREATSARLAATARILAQQPSTQIEAQKTYEYIAKAYGDTAIARQIPSSTQQTQGEI